MKLFWVEPENKRSDRGGELMWKLLERTDVGSVRSCLHCLLCSPVYLMTDILSVSHQRHFYACQKQNVCDAWKSKTPDNSGRADGVDVMVPLDMLCHITWKIGFQHWGLSSSLVTSLPVIFSGRVAVARMCHIYIPAECKSMSLVLFSVTLISSRWTLLEFTDENDICQHLHSICLH